MGVGGTFNVADTGSLFFERLLSLPSSSMPPTVSSVLVMFLAVEPLCISLSLSLLFTSSSFILILVLLAPSASPHIICHY